MKQSSILSLVAVTAVGFSAYWLGSRRDISSSNDLPTQSEARAITSSVPSFREILNDPNPITFQSNYLSFLQSLEADEARAVAEILWATPGDLQRVKDRQKLFAYAWGALNGGEAVDFVFSENSVAKVPALSQAFAGWASKNPNEARKWIDSKLRPSERLLYRWALVDGWARHDPNAASDYVLGMEELPGRDRFMRSIALEQVVKDPQGAVAWADTLPSGSLKSAAVDEVALRWSQVDPANAASWAGGLENSGEMKRAMNISMTQWTRMDTEEPSEFLNQLEKGAPRDHALAAYVNVLASEDLNAITEWAKEIGDSALREKTLVRIAQESLERFPEKTEAWLARSGLSEKAIEGIR